MYRSKLDEIIPLNNNLNNLTVWCSTVQPTKCPNLWAPSKWWGLRKWESLLIKQIRKQSTTQGSIKLLIHCQMIYTVVNFLLTDYKKKFPSPVWCQISTGSDRTMTMSRTCPLYQVIMNIQINMVIGVGSSQATTTNRAIDAIRQMFIHRPYRRPVPLLKAQTRRRTQTTS